MLRSAVGEDLEEHLVEIVREAQVFDVVFPEQGTQALRKPFRPSGGCGAARDLLTTLRRKARSAGEPTLLSPLFPPETAESDGVRVLHESSIADSLERSKHSVARGEKLNTEKSQKTALLSR